MKRKLLSVILAASMVAACLAGCGSDAGTQETAPAESEAPAEETGEEAEASGTESSGAKKLVFWDKAEYVDEYGSMMKAVVDKFAEEQGVEVDYVNVPSADMKQKLMAAIEAGNAPDLIVGDDTLVGQFASLNQLESVDDIMSEYDFTEAALKVGNYFVPGYLQKDGSYLCFFPFPYTMTAREFKNAVKITATDLAGNVSKSHLTVMAFERTFRHDKIDIKDNFLEAVQNKLSHLAPNVKNPLECYLYINNEVRAANVDALRNLKSDTAAAILWEGAFLRLPRSVSRAGFADHRYFSYQGKPIGESWHLGFDLASIRNAEVPAANNGRVIFTGEMGIYGNLLVIDHGLGVMSLYSHLSEILVKAGEVVGKGQLIGKTGSTGLAFGDHLHFGMLVGGVEVTPLEWIDPRWIRTSVVERIGAEFFPGAGAPAQGQR